MDVVCQVNDSQKDPMTWISQRQRLPPPVCTMTASRIGPKEKNGSQASPPEGTADGEKAWRRARNE